MQKLKNSVLDTMLQSHMTRAEVNFLLELSHYQDDRGCVYGVYYKSVCEATGISFETFYVTMKSLEEKGLIKRQNRYYGDYDILICGNDFSYAEAFQEGYIDTGLELFYDDKFKALKAGEQLLAMQFIKITGAGGKYHIAVQKFYDKWSRLLDVSKRTIQVYLTNLRAFFSIGIKDGYWIRPLAHSVKERVKKDVECLKQHLGQVAGRRNRATYTEKHLNDTVSLINQYQGYAKQKSIAAVFLDAVRDSIQMKNQEQRKKSKWDRSLNPKFIHQLMRINIC